LVNNFSASRKYSMKRSTTGAQRSTLDPQDYHRPRPHWQIDRQYFHPVEAAPTSQEKP